MMITFAGGSKTLKPPNVCPHCHNTIQATYVWHTPSGRIRNICIAVFYCVNSKCNNAIVCEYFLEGTSLKFKRFLNGIPQGPIWPKPILDLKSQNQDEISLHNNFIKTYLQSLVAENQGLDEIAGMGFRKSIEYLVKDWAIQNKPEDAETIRNLWLGQVINTYYEGDLKSILERATWLGNDQSHYNKLFEEYSITDLKELIDLIMVELDRQSKMKHYIDNIQKRK